jgi:hypothetical protein
MIDFGYTIYIVGIIILLFITFISSFMAEKLKKYKTTDKDLLKAYNLFNLTSIISGVIALVIGGILIVAYTAAPPSYIEVLKEMNAVIIYDIILIAIAIGLFVLSLIGGVYVILSKKKTKELEQQAVESIITTGIMGFIAIFMPLIYLYFTWNEIKKPKKEVKFGSFKSPYQTLRKRIEESRKNIGPLPGSPARRLSREATKAFERRTSPGKGLRTPTQMAEIVTTESPVSRIKIGMYSPKEPFGRFVPVQKELEKQ